MISRIYLFQKFDVSIAMKLVEKISSLDFLPLCTDQCAIHVLQKVVKLLPISAWSFFVKFLCRDDNLMTVCQDKYGCRLVQQTIDKLSDNPKVLLFLGNRWANVKISSSIASTHVFSSCMDS